MQKKKMLLAIAMVLAATASGDVLAAKDKSGHKFKGSVELQLRSNNNISVAPSSGSGFDFAELSEFGEDESEDPESDDEDEEDEGDDAFDDLVDVDPDEDEIEEDDALDEDGDGIDDLLDPNTDTVVDSERRVTTKFGLNHKYKFANGTTSWNNGVKLSSDRHGDRDDLDKFNYAFTTGFDFAPKDSRHAFKTSLSYVTLEKDDSKFVSTFVVSLGYEFEVSKRLSLGATYNYQDKDVSDFNSPDARIDTLSLSADFKATDNDIFKLKVAPKVEDSTKVTRSSDAYGFEVTYTRKLPWDMTGGIGYKFDSVDNKNLQPRRKDDNKTWGVEFTKDFGKSFAVGFGYETRDRSSNIPGKDAQNDSTYIEAGWKF